MKTLALLLLVSLPASASGFFVQASSGPAFATFFPVDALGVAEHFARNGVQSMAGLGYGFDAGPLRLELGLRLQHLHEQVEGSYSIDEATPSYVANYDYAAALLDLSLTTRFESRVNPYLALTVGSALLFSDRMGQPLRNHPLPIYGSLDAGLLLRLVDGVEARVGVSWVPPLGGVSVLAPQFGLRVAL
ncbi:MAG: hypothetical protein IPJ65_28960 [Archangiaceae bacterium]|nr:hypothetical protein [Archangiaceae bacterium]